MEKPTDDEQGRRLLTAVERIVAKSASVRATVDKISDGVKVARPDLKGHALRDAVAAEVVQQFSTRAAIAGGVSGLPALIPGIGTAAALATALGGTLAELTLLLKWEVEMALALSHLYGFDIEQPTERQLAFLMASVGTYDARGKNFFADVLRLEGTAIWNYAPRRIPRVLAQVLAALAGLYVWRGLLKAIPVVGIVAGSSINKVLTQKVGARCIRDLQTRRELVKDEPRSAAPSSGRKPKKKASKSSKPAAKSKKVSRRETPPAQTLN